MKQDEIEKFILSHEELEKFCLPFLSPKESYLEAADLFDYFRNKSSEIEWEPTFINVYYKQEPNTDEDISNILKRKAISLREGAHLLIGTKLNNMSAVVTSKPVLHIYKMALNDIQNKRLKTEDVDEEDYQQNHVLKDEITFHSDDQNISIWIQGTTRELAYYFKPHVLIDWALSIGLLLNEKLLQVIGALPVAKCDELMKQEAFYLSSNYLLYAEPLLLTKNELKDLSLLSIAQVLWYTTPDMTIEKMPENRLIKKHIPREGYSNKDIFRNKVKIIDPRVIKSRPKKCSNILKKTPDAPIIIPGVLNKNENNQIVWNHSRLKYICKSILETLLQINNSLDEEYLLNHDLIKLYTKDLHPIVNAMLKDWISEAKLKVRNMKIK